MITGAWLARARVTPDPSKQSDRDPEHTNPTPNPQDIGGQTPGWVSTVAAPLLPHDVYPSNMPTPLPTGIGPVDQTPESHMYGAGTPPAPGLLEAQDDASGWRMDDRGAVAAHAYNAPVDRDGTPHLYEQPDMIGEGESPAQLQYQRSGIGQPNDPNARHAKRQKRWYERYIDFHRYEATPTAWQPQHARPVPATMPPAGRTQLDSPYPNSVALMTNPVDRFVGPVMRRSPGPWDEGVTTDGTTATLAGVPTGYGLTQYGL